MEPTHEALHDALSRVIDPEIRKPVTELDMVRGIVVDGGDVTVTIALTVVGCPLRELVPGAGRARGRRRSRASRRCGSSST